MRAPKMKSLVGTRRGPVRADRERPHAWQAGALHCSGCVRTGHRNSALYICNIAYNELEGTMASIVVCAEPGSWKQARRFAENLLGDAELKSFEDLRRRGPVPPLLGFLTSAALDQPRPLLPAL